MDAGVVDLCLPLPALGAELARLARHPCLVRSTATALTPTPGLTQVLALVQAATGVDFGEHRPAAVRRRLARRMAVRNVKNVTAYLQVLRREPAEAQALHDDLLVRSTSFFQDEESFDALRTVALPDILRHKPPGAPALPFTRPPARTGPVVIWASWTLVIVALLTRVSTGPAHTRPGPRPAPEPSPTCPAW